MNEGTEFAEFMEKYGGSGALRPQTYWISDPDGKIRLDFVGRFENLHADFETVCRHLGKSDSSLPHKLNGNTSNYRSAYSDYSRGLVEKLYEEEIKQFGYEF